MNVKYSIKGETKHGKCYAAKLGTRNICMIKTIILVEIRTRKRFKLKVYLGRGYIILS